MAEAKAEAKAFGPAGIDLGTSTSLIACVRPHFNRQQLQIVHLNHGASFVQSLVSYRRDRRMNAVGIKNEGMDWLFAAKRFIGLHFDARLFELAKKMQLPFRVVSDSAGMPVLRTTPTLRDGKAVYNDYYPHEVSAEILKYLKSSYTRSRKTAIGVNEDVPVPAVISIPAAFREPQRRGTKQAAQLAGLEVKRLIHEPTAAAVAHLHEEKENINGHYIVFDFGGGTHDVSIIEVTGRVFTVRTTTGDPFLGGHDIDVIIFDYLVKEFKAKGGLAREPLARKTIDALQQDATRVKEQLSYVEEVDSDLDTLVLDEPEVKVTTTRALLAKLLKEHLIFEKMMIPVTQALQEANLKKSELKACLLAGGTTKIPAIVDEVRKFFKPVPVMEHKDGPLEVVARGAAIVANNEDSFTLKECLRFPLGVDISPEADGTDFMIILKAQSVIPAQASRTFWTIRDGQTQMDFNIYEGKDNKTRLTSDCTVMGQFTLFGIPPLPRGEAKVVVTMSLDASGLLFARAVCEQNEKSNEIKIDQSDAKIGQVDEKTQAKLNQLTELAYRLSLSGTQMKALPKVLSWLHGPRPKAITEEDIDKYLQLLK